MPAHAQTREPVSDLFAIGGGVREPRVIQKWVDAGGGSKGRFTLVFWASTIPYEVATGIVDQLHAAGVPDDRIDILGDLPDSEPKRLEAIEKISRSTAIYLSGGDQTRAMSVFGDAHDSRILNAFRAASRKGVPVASTSAGTAMQTRYMIAGDPTFAGQAPPMAKGLGNLSPEVILDQHFFKRGRWKRLIPLVRAQGPGTIGIGIDEDGAIRVRGGRYLEVLARSVMVVDAAPTPGSEPRIYTLSEGDTLDIKTRQASNPRPWNPLRCLNLKL